MVNTTYLTVLSVDPDTAYSASQVKSTQRTLSVCPSNVFITPVLFRSHVLSVLSQDEDKIHKLCSLVSAFLLKDVTMQETVSRCPSIVASRGPPGRAKEGWRGVIIGGFSSKAAVTSCLRTRLKWKSNAFISLM